MGIPVDASQVIERPIEDVFAFVSNLENSPLWGRTDKTTKVSDGPISVGTIFREEARFMGRRIDSLTEVTEFDPPTKFTYVIPEGSAQGRATFSFEAVREGTRANFTGEAELGRFADLLSPIFSRLINRDVKSLFQRLKDLLEAPEEPPV